VTEDVFVAQTREGPIAGHVSGSGPALLLLHGGPALSDYMDLLYPETDGWRCVRYQQRGLTPSAVSGPFTVQRHVADAVAVLDTLGAGRAVVLGHSWGGFLALQLAASDPGRVAGLVIVDPLGAVGDGGVAEMGQHLAGRMAPSAAARFGEVAARLAEPGATDADALESLRLLWPSYFADPAAAAPFPPGMRTSLEGYRETFASVAEQLAGGFGEQLRQLKVPAVFVLGGQSPMPLSQGQQTAALMPSAEVVVVPGAGHLPWHERPGCVAAALETIRERAAGPDAAP
jgi:pimeloyl-ACP methyl ester carboxylesterase